MKITLYMSVKKREIMLQNALIAGFKHTGDQVEYCATSDFRGPREWSDVAVFVGVKSHTMYEECKAAGQMTLLIDKAYTDRRDAYRFSLGGFQPFYLDTMKENTDRMRQLGININPRVVHANGKRGTHIVYAGSSQKYCDWHGLGDCNDYAVNVCAAILQQVGNSMPVLYRPKPSWWTNETIRKVVPEGTTLSGPTQSFRHVLQRCHCVVTHGSNAAVESLMFGVPVILTSAEGVSPVYKLAETRMDGIFDPYWPSDEARIQVMSNLAHCQFHVPEIQSGLAWATVKKHLKV